MNMLRSWKPLLASAFMVATLVLSSPQAGALPPGGANGVNTPGTSSSISPTSLRAGDTISFSISGFPANEQVYVKVDNGQACPRDSAQGACVVHQQKTDGNGSAQGSFVLSKELAEGEHTLRFLSTEVVRDDQGQQLGTRGYSNRSPVFTITGTNENSSGGTVINVDPQVINKAESQQQPHQPDKGSEEGLKDSRQEPEKAAEEHKKAGNESADQSSQEDVTYLDADGKPISKEEFEALSQAENEQKETPAGKETAVSASVAPSSSASSEPSSSSPSEQNQAKQSVTDAADSSSVPWIGIIGLGLAALIAGGVWLRRRNS